MAIQPDGKIVLAGHEQGSTTYAFFNGIVVRLNSNGGLDGSFAGGSGVYSFHRAGGGYDGFNAVALQNDGNIVVAGAATEANPNALFVRLNGAGAPDPSFGNGGVSSLSAGTFTSAPIGANGVGIAGGGRIVGGGAVQLNGTDNRAGLWAFTPSGAPDTEGGFSGGGAIAAQTGVEGCGLAIAPDGTLVTVGDSVSATGAAGAIPCTPNSTSTGFVARYTGFGPPPPATQPGAAPTVSTGSASGISQIAATVSGQVNPNGLATSYHFDYGTSPSYGSTTPAASAGAARAATPVSVTLTGLQPGATYHYRIDASNSAGSSTGSDETFTTSPVAAPGVSTGAAKRVTEVSAMISGTVATNGLSTKYHVEYGPKKAYGSSTAASTLATAASAVGVDAPVRGLIAGKTYHYRLVASNSAGTSYGADRTFRTLPRLVTSFPKVGKTYRISSILTGGLALKIGCSQACSVKGSLQVSTSVAKRLKLGKHGLSIGGGSASLKGRGSTKLVLRFIRAFKTALKHAGSFTGTLRVITSPVGGGKSNTLSKSVTLRP